MATEVNNDSKVPNLMKKERNERCAMIACIAFAILFSVGAGALFWQGGIHTFANHTLCSIGIAAGVVAVVALVATGVLARRMHITGKDLQAAEEAEQKRQAEEAEAEAEAEAEQTRKTEELNERVKMEKEKWSCPNRQVQTPFFDSRYLKQIVNDWNKHDSEGKKVMISNMTSHHFFTISHSSDGSFIKEIASVMREVDSVSSDNWVHLWERQPKVLVQWIKENSLEDQSATFFDALKQEAKVKAKAAAKELVTTEFVAIRDVTKAKNQEAKEYMKKLQAKWPLRAKAPELYKDALTWPE